MWRTALILFICAISLADEAPQSDLLQMSAGQEALRHYSLACLAARETFYRTVIDADQKKITDLDRAMKIAMNVGNLDEANRIKTAQEDAQDVLKQHKEALLQASESKQPTQPEAAQVFAIFAHERWKMTINVKKGERYRVTAAGQWSGGTDQNKNRLVCGPEGMVVPDGDHQGNIEWFLEGRVNHKYPFVIGAKSEFVADEDGPLEMQMRDWWIYDNDGSIVASVQHVPNAGP
jgi:hypothetical protein